MKNEPSAERAQYRNVPNDGASYRCRECDTEMPFDKVVQISPRTYDKWVFGTICHDCLAELWGDDWQKAERLPTP